MLAAHKGSIRVIQVLYQQITACNGTHTPVDNLSSFANYITFSTCFTSFMFAGLLLYYEFSLMHTFLCLSGIYFECFSSHISAVISNFKQRLILYQEYHNLEFLGIAFLALIFPLKYYFQKLSLQFQCFWKICAYMVQQILCIGAFCLLEKSYHLLGFVYI